METLRLSKDDLLARHTDEEWRSNFLKAARLGEFLAGSILREKYKIPDEIVNTVHLTEYGNKILQRLVVKNDVPAKEARLICFLRLVHREPLVDLTRTDLAELHKLIDRQIRERELLFPFILGRDLYDRAASMYDDARDTLSHAETLRLLDGLPIGVFQADDLISGPYGLLQSKERRWFGPVSSVPMYHCSELTCSAIHSTRLSSDHNAPINQHQQAMERVLEALGDDESEWGEFIQHLAGTDGFRYDDRSLEPLWLALADLFADDELRTLLAHLLDSTGAEYRSQLEPLALVGRSDDIAASIESRAGLIQVLLLTDNATLVAGIDQLVLASDQDPRRIEVEAGEIRRLVTNQRLAYGTFGTYPELSSLGVRFTSDEHSLGPMRLKRLVDELYSLDRSDEVDELQWQLRSVEGDDPPERLEEFVRSAEPDEVIERLILSRRTNLVLACERLGLRYDDFADDATFVQAALWKLGFYRHEATDLRSNHWQQFLRLKRFCQTAGVGARVDPVELRSKTANYFVELEGVLDDALSFATWALTFDHLGAERPFDYEPTGERLASFKRLNEFESADKAAPEMLLGDKNTLQPLISGFGRLADLLENMLENSGAHRRDSKLYPHFAQHTSLKKFPFEHTAIFLDLLPRSQGRILESLKFVRETLDRGSVAATRNEHMHYRATSPEISKLDSALDSAEKAVSRLEADGLSRTLFRQVSDRGDSWGRRIFTLRSAKGTEIAFARPSAYDWLRMPLLGSGPQYLMPAAVLAQPNEVLRFRQTFATSYARYWQNYPSRRPPRVGVIGARVGSSQDADL
ncbi:hypothetical protein [Nocardioides alkalitolerans]|uniref:hypothetical protein n=1 Tax=Nocardioides alkalitolerans TaxID=281714 RepID=UPI00041A0093|nr:hypothetical protein [Nocardioides alkalitolerans]